LLIIYINLIALIYMWNVGSFHGIHMESVHGMHVGLC